MSQPPVAYHEHLKTVAVFGGVVSPEECQRLVDLPVQALDAAVDDGTTGGVNYRLRRTRERVVPPTPDNVWIFRRLAGLVTRFNADAFRFQLNNTMTVSVLEYSPEGFFDWHLDLGAGGIESLRKISLVTFLTPPADYEGGGLCFLDAREPMRLAQGDTVVFPSYLVHRVEPVTRGTRYTLVSWVHGPPFS